MFSKWLMACGWLLVMMAPIFALTIDVPLRDTAQEARARNLFYEIRCVVCQSEAIADSPADVAADMRRVIRERISAGDSDEAIKQYLVSRYGHFILMKPPLESITWPLWFGPLILLGLAGLLAKRLFPSPLEGEGGAKRQVRGIFSPHEQGKETPHPNPLPQGEREI